MPAPRVAGVVPMLPTPFDESGKIVWDDFAPVIAYQLQHGVHGLAALGLGGESGRLTTSERLRVAETVLPLVPDGFPVIIGVTADDTATACNLAEHATTVGAAAVMVAPPDSPAASRQELHDHYVAVCAAAGRTAVMIQDAPAFIRVALGADFISALADTCDNVRYAKSEAFPAAERTAGLAVRLGDRIGIFGGASALHLIDVLDAGAIGIIPGCEAPAQFVRIFESYAAGARREAAGYFARLQPLLVFETQTLDIFIASSKAVLKSRGLIRSDSLRGPNPLGEWSRQVLQRHVQAALADG